MRDIETLINDKKLIDNKWVIARPERYIFISRIIDCIQILCGKADVVTFYKQ